MEAPPTAAPAVAVCLTAACKFAPASTAAADEATWKCCSSHDKTEQHGVQPRFQRPPCANCTASEMNPDKPCILTPIIVGGITEKGKVPLAYLIVAKDSDKHTHIRCKRALSPWQKMLESYIAFPKAISGHWPHTVLLQSIHAPGNQENTTGGQSRQPGTRNFRFAVLRALRLLPHGSCCSNCTGSG